MKITKWLLATLPFLSVGGLLFLVVLMRPREFGVAQVIARTNVGETRFVLTQSYQGLSEGNEVQFFVKEKLGRWSSYYIEHEDTYWRNADLALVHEGIEIRRGKNVVAFYDLVSKRYYLGGRGIWTSGDASAKDRALLESK